MKKNLAKIAARIKAEHNAVTASAKRCMEHAITAGELLLKAKDQLSHGEWLPWLEKHTGVTPRSARNYMKLAKHRDELESKYETVSHLTVREALNALAYPTIALASLETEEARNTAIKSIVTGTNPRTAVRAARKHDYYARTQAAKPKPLEGRYRIIYADPPWDYQDEKNQYGFGHGYAKHHYDSMTIEQLCDHRPGDGSRTVKELAEKDAVLFMWITSPILPQCFPIIEAWGFKYKASFVWDKVRQGQGFYNSVCHELLLICTRGNMHARYDQAY
jgi:hypothetical protein